jgi:hypothetical protein
LSHSASPQAWTLNKSSLSYHFSETSVASHYFNTPTILTFPLFSFLSQIITQTVPSAWQTPKFLWLAIPIHPSGFTSPSTAFPQPLPTETHSWSVGPDCKHRQLALCLWSSCDHELLVGRDCSQCISAALANYWLSDCQVKLLSMDVALLGISKRSHCLFSSTRL